jgi:hypothetical protein
LLIDLKRPLREKMIRMRKRRWQMKKKRRKMKNNCLFFIKYSPGTKRVSLEHT